MHIMPAELLRALEQGTEVSMMRATKQVTPERFASDDMHQNRIPDACTVTTHLQGWARE